MVDHYSSAVRLFSETPVTEIQLSVTLNFNFRFVREGSDEADYFLHDLNLRCEGIHRSFKCRVRAGV
jgi:hypothetical protein